jgi:hypothetical protein
MTRSQRRWHIWLWLALGPLTFVGLLMALSARPPIATRSLVPSIAPPANGVEPAVKPPTGEGRP